MALYIPQNNDEQLVDNDDEDISYLCDKKIFTISNQITSKDCKSWIERAEKQGFNQSAPSGGGHGRTGLEDARTSQFVVFQNEEQFATTLYDQIKQYLPLDLTHLSSTGYITSKQNAKKWKPIGINPYIRIYKYEVGQTFPEHIDYKMRRNVYKNGELYHQMTFMSLLIYLNDDFNGGITGFWTEHDVIGKKEHCRFLRGVEHKPHNVVIKPVTGKIVIMDQNILHEGLPPNKGIKYILRTDIIHEKYMPKNEKLLKFDKQQKKSVIKSKKQENDELNKVCEWEKLFETSCKNYAD